MTAKIRIKAGPVEFEYEGETELAVADIKELFSHIETLFKVPVLAEGGDGAHPQQHGAPTYVEQPQQGGSKQMLHVNSIASALGAKSGSEVAVAAAASLQIYEGKETFTRSELLDTMKKATMHYKDSMSGNLSKALTTLVGSKFNQIKDGVYSLNKATYDQLVGQLD
ncbi:hypothetical protein ATY76_01045 [Rhizobium sp. R339]|uniref:hypothetical protein n=1 Tax=Rhizobium sp. R339 TaxID=1764273 RepID=UPI000B52F627|nr:hypothetical protein [Rhizobium sp. R339]OWV76574.1 hypothetical protein ATY76_01045 [Rhizobium sp. R339]